MIAVSYDETTGFEGFDRDKMQPTMIAGVIYQDESDDLERKRICAYLKAVCDSAGSVFPEDLHSNPGDKGNSKTYEEKRKQQEPVAKTKEVLNKTLAEFIRKGTFRSQSLNDIENGNPLPERRGFYRILALVKKWQEQDLSADGQLQSAENLYLKMVDKVLLKAGFLTLPITESNTKVHFDIPTRIVPGNQMDGSQKKIFKALGFKENIYKDKKTGKVTHQWSIMEPGDSRQIINKYMGMMRGRIAVPSFGGSEIFTRSMKDGYTSSAPSTDFAFMFLSDAICSYLKDQLYEEVMYYDIMKKLNTAIRCLHKTSDSDTDSDIELLSDTLDHIKESINKRQKRHLFKKESIPAVKRAVTDEAKKALQYVKDSMKEKNERFQTIVAFDEEYCKIIRAKLRRLDPTQNSLFFYEDEVDTCYNKAAVYAVNKDIFSALSYIYDGMNTFKGGIKNYYKVRWFPKIEKAVLDTTYPETKAGFLRALEETRKTLQEADNISQGKLLYVYEKLEEVAHHFHLSNEEEFFVYNIGISAYTHVGNPKKAEECYNKCLPFKNYVETADFKKAENRMITVCNDQFRFAEAEQIAAATIEWKKEYFPKSGIANPINQTGLRKFGSFIRKLFGKRPEEIQLLEQLAPPTVRKSSYKAWSSLGQTYAFENREEAERCFRAVLEVLSEEKDSNYYISLSYLLHWYIESGNRKKYEEFAKEYFNGEEDLEGQLKYILNEDGTGWTPGVSFNYSFFVYIKAFYVFYKAREENRGILHQLANVDEEIKPKVKSDSSQEALFTGHPWEIIYKYSALLEAYDSDPKQYHGENIRKSKQAVPFKEFIIDGIIEYGELEYRKQKAELHPENDRLREAYEKKASQLWKNMAKYDFVKMDDAETISDKVDILSKKFTYMYH